jgi:hypothetical protein
VEITFAIDDMNLLRRGKNSLGVSPVGFIGCKKLTESSYEVEKYQKTTGG